MEKDVVEILDVEDDMDKKKSKKGLIIAIILIIIVSVGATIIVMNIIKPKVFSIENLNDVLGESKSLVYYDSIDINKPECESIIKNNERIIFCKKELFLESDEEFVLVYTYESSNGTQELRRYYSRDGDKYDPVYTAETSYSIESVGMLENNDEKYYIVEEENSKGSLLKIINEKGELVKELTNKNSLNYYTAYEVFYSKDGDSENAYITYFNCDNNENKLTQSVYNINTNKEVDILKIDNISCRDNTSEY